MYRYSPIEKSYKRAPSTGLAAFISIVATAVVVSAGVYLWQSRAADIKVKDLQQQLTAARDENSALKEKAGQSMELGKEIENLRTQNANLREQLISLKAGTEKDVKRIIESRSREVIRAIKNKDMSKLSSYTHPDKGVRFSPYGYVDTEKDRVYTAAQLAGLVSDGTKYIWGAYDGSGEPIELTFEEYYDKFVYDKDFAAAEEVGYNRIIGRGNTLNNIFEVYPKAIVVEYHFSGFDPQYSGMDWRSLRLVFEEKGGAWYLIGIVHDQWTI